jgi:hypothetical protein
LQGGASKRRDVRAAAAGTFAAAVISGMDRRAVPARQCRPNLAFRDGTFSRRAGDRRTHTRPNGVRRENFEKNLA